MLRPAFLADQMLSTRRYTLQVLEHTDRQRWFQMPMGQEGPVTHIAWHIGHLVFAKYAQFILRIFGERPEDQKLIPKERYFAVFAKGTAPAADQSIYPPIDEVLQYFHSIHEHCVTRLAAFPDERLDEPLVQPHQIAVTKLDMAMWSIKHEMLHTGQMALVRRLLGEKPWR